MLLEHGVLREEFLRQSFSCYTCCALRRLCGWERLDKRLQHSRHLGIRLCGQSDSNFGTSDRNIWKGGQGHGLAQGRQGPHHALRVFMAAVVVIVVMMVVLMGVHVGVLVVVVQRVLVVMLVGMNTRSMLVIVVLTSEISLMVVCRCVMFVQMLVAVPMAVGVMVVTVGHCVVSTVVMGMCAVGCVCVIVAVVVACPVGVSVVGLVGLVMQFLLPLSSLWLKDLTLHADHTFTSGSGIEGSLAEALVSKLAGHEGTVSTISSLGAGGLLDGVFHIVIRAHREPRSSTANFEESEALVQSTLFVELLQGESDELLNLSFVCANKRWTVGTGLCNSSCRNWSDFTAVFVET